ncbi:relaxase/mobilization nuclease domain-containing protein [Pseudomonas eucalypticola]|uniref:Relaxase/mobilization nuclease domain-containing protein n=1 Tax=Pseudomonas eucalypticola TaxID=2599595 RepID=A0A7D5H9T4_9PSED|nr:relaxase/mobilization nuclease domain-containing protein [Pseudomonas eucalypticola]QKZ07843.1 relaxase/mobilization nuclease domain-containing protein [Pseudomonas eucalypticola]
MATNDAGGFSREEEHSIEFAFGHKRPKGQRLKLGKAGAKAQAWRTVTKAPEVIVRVSGGGKTAQHVKAHFDYITRRGQLEMVNDQGETIRGKDQVADLFDSWDMDLSKGQGELRQAFNVVLSMPAGTDPQKVLAAAQGFARETLYGKHQYAMVLHTQETDPHKDAPPHPHVHLIIKAEGYNGKRLHIRKATLQAWRETFAEQLRDRGIEANATPRAVRGVTKKSKGVALFHLEKKHGREESHVYRAKVEEAIKELNAGTQELKPWEKAIINRRQKTLREMLQAAKTYEAEGDKELADAIRKHAASLPRPETERHAIKAEVAQELQRIRDQGKQRGPEAARGDKDKER